MVNQTNNRIVRKLEENIIYQTDRLSMIEVEQIINPIHDEVS